MAPNSSNVVLPEHETQGMDSANRRSGSLRNNRNGNSTKHQRPKKSHKRRLTSKKNSLSCAWFKRRRKVADDEDEPYYRSSYLETGRQEEIDGQTIKDSRKAHCEEEIITQQANIQEFPQKQNQADREYLNGDAPGQPSGDAPRESSHTNIFGFGNVENVHVGDENTNTTIHTTINHYHQSQHTEFDIQTPRSATRRQGQQANTSLNGETAQQTTFSRPPVPPEFDQSTNASMTSSQQRCRPHKRPFDNRNSYDSLQNTCEERKSSGETTIKEVLVRRPVEHGDASNNPSHDGSNQHCLNGIESHGRRYSTSCPPPSRIPSENAERPSSSKDRQKHLMKQKVKMLPKHTTNFHPLSSEADCSVNSSSEHDLFGSLRENHFNFSTEDNEKIQREKARTFPSQTQPSTSSKTNTWAGPTRQPESSRSWFKRLWHSAFGKKSRETPIEMNISRQHGEECTKTAYEKSSH